MTRLGECRGQSLTGSGVAGQPSLTTGADQTSNVGSYAINAALGTLSSGNYAFVLHDGTLTVTKAPLDVTADDKSRLYGDADPSLTAWQLLAAIFTMLYVLYRAPDTRIVFTAFFFVALMFGMLRLSGMKLAVLGSISLLYFALVVWLRYAGNHDAGMLRLDMLQFGVMAVTFPWFLFIGGHVKQLQRGFDEVSVKLEDIEEKARHDDLTGVYNRRAMIVAMEESKQRADAAGEPLSICVIDLDFFKRYNDEFDHLTGDKVLRAFAQGVQGGLRATDVFGRYGGEEFVQILRHTALAGAMAEAERLRERINAIDIPVSRAIGPLTVSIGVAQYEPGETIIETFARADAALYKAKQRGRNRVEC